jgi:hypothetical protein
MTKHVFMVAMFSISALSCGDFRRRLAGPSASTSESATAPTGRFVLLQAQRTSTGGTVAPVVVRMDSQTGETWILDVGEPTKWISVEDNLKPIGKYDSATGRVDWGVKLPDGRYLNDLSKEELVRHLGALIIGKRDGSPKK